MKPKKPVKKALNSVYNIKETEMREPKTDKEIDAAAKVLRDEAGRRARRSLKKRKPMQPPVAPPMATPPRPMPMQRPPQSGMPMASPPAFKKGGKVKKTGMALVHKGEKVLTAKQANKPIIKKAMKRGK